MVVLGAGIDTASVCWYVDEGSPAARAMGALATRPVRRGMRLPEPVDGFQVGWFPGSSLVYAEGHPGSEGVLGAPNALEGRIERLTAALVDVGVVLPLGRAHRGSTVAGVGDRPGLAGVRRMDATVDVEFEDTSHGLALLAGVAAVDAGRLDRDVRYNGLSIGTVSWLSARGKVARVYDKGAEANTAPRGGRIRLEAQYRWPREARRGPDELTAGYVREKFHQRFVPLWRAASAGNGIKVVGKMAMVDQLRAAVEAGELSWPDAERILGYQLLAAGEDRGMVQRHTAWRRRRLIEESGFVLADGRALDDVDVDLAELLDEVMGTDAWEREG